MELRISEQAVRYEASNIMDDIMRCQYVDQVIYILNYLENIMDRYNLILKRKPKPQPKALSPPREEIKIKTLDNDYVNRNIRFIDYDDSELNWGMLPGG